MRDGAVVGTVGEKVTLGGGHVGASFDTLAYQRTPAACAHEYWLVGAVVATPLVGEAQSTNRSMLDAPQATTLRAFKQRV